MVEKVLDEPRYAEALGLGEIFELGVETSRHDDVSIAGLRHLLFILLTVASSGRPLFLPASEGFGPSGGSGRRRNS